MFFTLVVLLSVPCFVLGVSITITSPKTGDIVRLSKSIDPMEPDASSNSLPLKFEIQGEFRIPEDGYITVNADGGEVNTNFLQPMSHINLVKLEPGTHTARIKLVRGVPPGPDADMSKTEIVCEDATVFDVIPAKVVLYFPPLRINGGVATAWGNFVIPTPRVEYGITRKISLGVIGSLKMDGQKSIWLRQFELLSRDHFDLRYLCFTANQTYDGKLMESLKRLNVDLALTDGLSIAIDLAEQPDFPMNLVRLIREQSDLSRWHQLRIIEQRFLQDFYRYFVAPMFGLDIVTFANSRSDIDVLIVEAARLAAIRVVVMEMPNLYPPSNVRADALVAPSHFVQGHKSVTTYPTPCYVINPGVDTEKFSPQAVALVRKATVQPVLQDNRWVVGFAARLAPEKSPGMFLRAAAFIIRQLGRDKVRFVMVGDGEIRDDLERFASLLGLGKDVLTFTGWLQGDALPMVFDTFDVLMNPSLRDSETFCIVNLEAMAIRVPIVTFGCCGISEYMRNETYGVVAGPDPTPESLAMHTVALLRDPARREAIADRAQQLVLQHYSYKSNVDKYSRLYAWLLHQKRSTPPQLAASGQAKKEL